jgi:hypothetical protein
MKNCKIQLFLEPETYIELKSFATKNTIPHKTDSQMIYNILKKIYGGYGDLQSQVYMMQQQINKHKEIEDQLQKDVEKYKQKAFKIIKERYIKERSK